MGSATPPPVTRPPVTEPLRTVAHPAPPAGQPPRSSTPVLSGAAAILLVVAAAVAALLSAAWSVTPARWPQPYEALVAAAALVATTTCCAVTARRIITHRRRRRRPARPDTSTDQANTQAGRSGSARSGLSAAAAAAAALLMAAAAAIPVRCWSRPHETLAVIVAALVLALGYVTAVGYITARRRRNQPNTERSASLIHTGAELAALADRHHDLGALLTTTQHAIAVIAASEDRAGWLHATPRGLRMLHWLLVDHIVAVAHHRGTPTTPPTAAPTAEIETLLVAAGDTQAVARYLHALAAAGITPADPAAAGIPPADPDDQSTDDQPAGPAGSTADDAAALTRRYRYLHHLASVAAVARDHLADAARRASGHQPPTSPPPAGTEPSTPPETLTPPETFGAAPTASADTQPALTDLPGEVRPDWSTAPQRRAVIRDHLDRILATPRPANHADHLRMERDHTRDHAAERRQLRRVDLLQMLYGRVEVAAAYHDWLTAELRRQQPTAQPLQSWDDLAFDLAPLPRWDRDRYGFQCWIGCCDSSFWQVVPIHGTDGMCETCARTTEHLQPHQVWAPKLPPAHGQLVHPGPPVDEPHTGPAIGSLLTDGTTREHQLGDAVIPICYHDLIGLQPTTHYAVTGPAATPRLRVTGAGTHPGPAGTTFTLHAIYDYDPTPQHRHTTPYGFRLTTATYTTNTGTGTSLTITDPYDLLTAMDQARTATHHLATGADPTRNRC